MQVETLTRRTKAPIATILAGSQAWKPWQLIGFRIAFIFYVLLIIPVDGEWYSSVVSSKIIFDFFNTMMRIGGSTFVRINTESGKWGIASYANWAAVFLIALTGAALWTILVRKGPAKEYTRLNYLLCVLIRYRIAVGILVFGFMKFYPVQMPYPGLGSLETNFGDFSGYKLYWHSIGLVPWYEVFLGCVEILAGTLLFFRPTVFFGAVLNFAVLYNIAHANHAYDGGVHVYSAVTVLFSSYLIAQYIPDLWKLLIKEEEVVPRRYVPLFTQHWQRVLKTLLKVVTVLSLTVWYGYLRYELHYITKETKAPSTPGLAHAQGYYHVTTFRVNGTELPYNPLDSVRWQEVIFEKYSTLVYKVNKTKRIPLDNGSRQENDIDREYELSGIGGGRTFLYYDADTLHQKLSLYDKGVLNTRIRKDREKNRGLDTKKGRLPDLLLHYERPSDQQIILSGLSGKDSLYVVLDRVEKQYPIHIVRTNSK